MTGKKLILPGEPEVTVSDGDEQEFEELGKIKVTDPKTGGVEYEGWAKRQAEWIERNFDDPGTLIDEPVPFDFWQAVADQITLQIRSTGSLQLRVVRDFVRKYAQSLFKNKANAMTPQRFQLDCHDMYTMGCRSIEDLKWRAEVGRCARINCYTVFQREYMNRRVG